ncbi:MAG: pilus assembly protein PilM, partial [Kiritimatiellae bacterium]|nr:pilus assembly protein PilM [Kiritimatiellia bacterium]
MAKRYLTLDIGASAVKLAEYEGGRGGLTLVNYGVAPLAAPLETGGADAVLLPAIQAIAREKGIRPGPVAVSVSGQMVFPRFASIAAAGGADKFDQQVLFEIEQNIPFPIDEMVCDRQILGESENGETAVMIVAAKTDQLEDIAAAVGGAGFTPELVDVAPLALTNVLWASGAAADECCVILDIGAKTTSLVIVDGNRLYNRSIPVAGNTITKEIAAALGCSQDEAEQVKMEGAYVALGGVVEDDDALRDRVSKVCRAVMTRLHAEISRSINFNRSQQGGRVPARLYLAGGTSLLPQVDRFFAESL